MKIIQNVEWNERAFLKIKSIEKCFISVILDLRKNAKAERREHNGQTFRAA